LAEARLSHQLPAPVPLDPVKLPLLSGSRVVVVDAPDGSVVLRPPPPGEPVADVGAAVRDAVRFPVAGKPLGALAAGARAGAGRGLVDVGAAGNVPLRVNRALVETDLVVTVSAAESVLHGGPGLLLGAGGSAALRAAGAYSLLETGASMGWRVALELERRLAGRTSLVGVSLVLNQPLYTGAARGYPYDPESLDRIARSEEHTSEL